MQAVFYSWSALDSTFHYAQIDDVADMVYQGLSPIKCVVDSHK